MATRTKTPKKRAPRPIDPMPVSDKGTSLEQEKLVRALQEGAGVKKEPGYEQEIGNAKLFLMSLQETIYAGSYRFKDNKVLAGTTEIEIQFGTSTEDKLKYFRALTELVGKAHEMLAARNRDRAKIAEAAKVLQASLTPPAEKILR